MDTFLLFTSSGERLSSCSVQKGGGSAHARRDAECGPRRSSLRACGTGAVHGRRPSPSRRPYSQLRFYSCITPTMAQGAPAGDRGAASPPLLLGPAALDTGRREGVSQLVASKKELGQLAQVEHFLAGGAPGASWRAALSQRALSAVWETYHTDSANRVPCCYCRPPSPHRLLTAHRALHCPCCHPLV